MDQDSPLSTPYGSTKRPPSLQNNMDEAQSPRSNIDKPSFPEGRSRTKFLQQIEIINRELIYIGIKPLEFYDQCSIDHLDELCKIISQLMASRTTQISKLADDLKKLNRVDFENRKLINYSDSLSFKIESLQKEKEELIENIKQMKREEKVKDEKTFKEKEAFAKERKAVESRQITMKNDFRKRDEKIKDLEDRCRKLLDKNSKIEYRNSIEVFQQFFKKGNQPTLVENQLKALSEKKRGKVLEEKDRKIDLFKTYLTQIFDRLSTIASSDEDYRQIATPDKFRTYLELPVEHSHVVVETLIALTTKIQGLLFDSGTVFADDLNADTSGLLSTIQQMKSYYTQAQQLDRTRSSFTSSLFRILDRKQKLNHTIIQRISKNLNRSNEHYMQVLLPEVQNLRNQQFFLKTQKEKEKDAVQFLHNQIEMMAHEADVMQTVKKEMGELFYLNHDNQQLL